MIFICYFPFKNSICTIVVFFCIYVLLKVKGMSFLCLGDLKKEKPGRNKVARKVLNRYADKNPDANDVPLHGVLVGRLSNPNMKVL